MPAAFTLAINIPAGGSYMCGRSLRREYFKKSNAKAAAL